MTDKHTLDLARQWAADIDADRETLSQDTIDAAADLISSLPDAWVDAEKLRVLADDMANWKLPHDPEESSYFLDYRALVRILDGFTDRVTELLPAPPAPESAAPRPDDVPEFDPAYTYSDRQGDKWECLDGWWFIGATHAERVAGRKVRPGRASPPEAFGPYTRIEEEEANE